MLKEDSTARKQGRKQKEIGEVAAMQFIPVGNERSVPKRLRQYISTEVLSQYNTP
jgi:hypothetical protein